MIPLWRRIPSRSWRVSRPLPSGARRPPLLPPLPAEASRPLTTASPLPVHPSHYSPSPLPSTPQDPPELIPIPELGSYVRGPLSPPLLQDTLPQYWAHLLDQYGARQALVSMHEPPEQYGRSLQHSPSNTGNAAGAEGRVLRWTYEEMDGAVKALARGLLAMGVRKGDRVGAVLPNCSAYAILQWATASIGSILVTFNPQYQPSELLSALNLTSCRALFVTPYLMKRSPFLSTLLEAIPALQSGSARPHELQDSGVRALRSLVLVDNVHDPQEWAGLMGRSKGLSDMRELMMWREDGWEAAEVRRLEGEGQRDEVINLQFTSGTTGLPKAVSLTHFNLLNNGRYIGDNMWLTPEDKLCNVPPLFHCFGLVLGNLAAWTHGSSIIYPSPFFDPPSILRTIASERCTALHGVPTHFLGVLGELEKGEGKWDVGCLRTGIAAGSPIPIELMKELFGQLNLNELTIAYGMTETSPVSFQTRPDDPLLKRAETVGRIMPQTTAKIVDEQGQVVPIGEHGELWVSGYLVQKGYWEDPEQTGKVIRVDERGVRWMMTGDVASMDEEGYLQIVGRIKDVIIRGGENLFPVQIENCLTDHHAIREAAVVAVPDPKYVEVPGAWVVRSGPKHPGSSHLTGREVREVVLKGMNRQNAPDYVWFLGEDGAPPELPKTASGKVMKHVLREWSRDLAAKGVGRVV